MLTDLALEEPNAPCAMRDTYMKWLDDRITVCCIMRVAINDELSCKFKDMQLKEMIYLLNESFGTLRMLRDTKSPALCSMPVCKKERQS